MNIIRVFLSKEVKFILSVRNSVGFKIYLFLSTYL